MDHLCRICADNLEQNGTNVFTPENRHVLSTIMICFPITISEGDGFPKSVCNRCLGTLNCLYNLRGLSVVAVEKFKQHLSAVDSGVACSDETVIIKEEKLSDTECYEEPEFKFSVEEVPNTISRDEHGCSPSKEIDYETAVFPNPAENEKYLCHDCGKSFCSKSDLNHHQRIHPGPGKFPCQFCPKTFSRYSYRIKHELRHSPSFTVYRCPECGESFRCKKYLNVHRETHANYKPFQCHDCGESFAMSSVFIQHQKTHHQELFSNNPHGCQVCGKSFSTKSKLNQHYRIHSLPVKMPKPLKQECGNGFCENPSLTQPLESNPDDNPFQCSECGECFSQVAIFMQHQRTHTSRKVFSCRLCEKSFSGFQYLKKHERKHLQLQSVNELHRCPECGKDFSDKRSLNQHLQTHVETKLYLFQ